MGTEAESFPHDCRSMDCRAFRKKHLAYVDDTLPGVEVVQMQRHISTCARCAQMDLAVRRSLLVVRNHLSPIEPSADFSQRLSARLESERRSLAVPANLFGSTTWATFAAMCGGVVTVGVLGLALMDSRESVVANRLPTVTFEATPALLQASPALVPDATPAFVATVSTGMAILPALLLAEEMPTTLEDSEPDVRTAGLVRTLPPDIR